MADKKKYVIVDGNSFVFRAFFALPQFTTSRGEVVNAVFGFAKMLLQVMKKHKPDLLCVAFDHKGKSFRHEEFVEYKANRAETPDELKSQFEPIKKFVRLLGLPLLEIEGVEADDSIGTFVALHKNEHTSIAIITGDKDMMQLVDNDVAIYDTMKEIMYTPEKVKEKMGVYPRQIPDLLGLMGDSADNIPGVPGIGPKGAQKLLEEYKSIEEIIAHKETISGSTGEKIRTGAESALLSKKLATVKHDIDLSHITWEHQKPNAEGLEAFLSHFEFRSLKKEIQDILPHGSSIETKTTPSPQLPEWKYLPSKAAFEKIQNKIINHGSVTVVGKYTLDKEKNKQLIALGLCTTLQDAYVVSFEQDISHEDVLTYLNTLAAQEGFLLTGHNLKEVFLTLEQNVQQEHTSQPTLFSI